MEAFYFWLPIFDYGKKHIVIRVVYFPAIQSLL